MASPAPGTPVVTPDPAPVATEQVITDVGQDAPAVVKDISHKDILGVVKDVGTAFDQIRPLAPAVAKEVKAGYKTTEFWLVIAFTVLTQLQALHLPGKYGDTIATIAAIVSYVISRGFAKLGGVSNVLSK